MFQRIKNLIDLSKYSADDFFLVRGQPRPGIVPGVITDLKNTEVASSTITVAPRGMAKIINLKADDPFADYETTEQSPDDSAARN